MLKYYLFYSFLILFTFLFGQKKEPAHYSYPWEESYKPVTIRINAILLKRDDGSGNFDMNDEEEKELFLQYNNIPNYVFQNFQKPLDNSCYQKDDFIKDAGIRFTVNVIEVKNTFFWNFLNSGVKPKENKLSGFSPSENWYMKPLDDSISNLNIPKGINVYYTHNGERFDDLYAKKGAGYDLVGKMAGQYPTSSNLRRSSQAHIPNRYIAYLVQRYQSTKEYKKSWEVTKYWWLSPGYAHEIAHNLGLGHANEYHGTNKCIYSLMSQRNGDKRNWLPPTEILKIHYNLSTTNLMQFVTPESHYGVTWNIEKDEFWDKPRRFYNNFEVAKDVTLTISDSIVLPTTASIKLNKKSKIVFEKKGVITDPLGNEFKNYIKTRGSEILRKN